VVDPPAGATEHQQIARAQADVDERPGAPPDAGEAEHAGVAEAERDYRGRRRLLPVLMEPELGARRVQVDDRRVRGEGRGDVIAERVGDRGACQADDLVGHRLDRRAVGVVGGRRVGVGLPVPAEAHRLHAHQVPGRDPRLAQPGGRQRPGAERRGQPALAVRFEPVGDVDDAGEQRRRPGPRQRQVELRRAGDGVVRERPRHAAEATGAEPPAGRGGNGLHDLPTLRGADL
jgi:hypothetical protein